MTDLNPVVANVSHSESKGSGKDQDNGTNGGTNAAPNTKDKHIVRILGTYSLLTFFIHKGQEQFFDKITDPNFEAIFSFDGPYARNTDSFDFDIGEKEFELRMTNLGFIREAFWKEAFPPIFKLNEEKVVRLTYGGNWYPPLPDPTRQKLHYIAASSSANSETNCPEASLYSYSLRKLSDELQKVRAATGATTEVKVHIGLNKFGIVNIGITTAVQDRI